MAPASKPAQILSSCSTRSLPRQIALARPVVAVDSDGNGFLRKYAGSASSPTLTDNVDLSAFSSYGGVTSIALDSADVVHVSGYTTNAALAGTVVNAHSGGTDAFVIKLSAGGGAETPSTVSYTMAITLNEVNDTPTVPVSENANRTD